MYALITPANFLSGLGLIYLLKITWMLARGRGFFRAFT